MEQQSADNRDNGEYKVGPGKPPLHTRFSSTNQPENSGRKHGSKSRSTIVRKWMEVEQNVKNPLTSETQNLSQEDIIILRQIKAARDGSTKAFEVLMDSIYGKIPNKLEADLSVQDTLAVAKLTKGMKEDGYTAEEIVAYLENGGMEEVQNE